MVQAANEIGLTPKMFGGALVGLQATVLQGQAQGQAQRHRELRDLGAGRQADVSRAPRSSSTKYQSRAKAEGVDPLGYYLGGWGYAYIKILGDAVKGAKSIEDDKIAAYLKKTTFHTLMGDIKFGKKGEWAQGRMLTVQYHDIKDDANLETWRGMSYQTVLDPPNLKTGNVIYPYEKAHK